MARKVQTQVILATGLYKPIITLTGNKLPNKQNGHQVSEKILTQQNDLICKKL